jgi:hypothetical protein
MNKSVTVFSGVGLGAGLMYLLDPDRGRRRRALVRDKAASSFRKTQEAADVTTRDVRNRTWGTLESIKSWFNPKPVDDRVLEERVRSKLGMLVRHPGSIEVTAQNGRVALSGPVLADEVDHVISMTSRVQGVRRIENRLEVHEDEDRVPGLQGSPKSLPRGGRFELMQVHWSPTARLLTGAAGSALTVYGARRRNLAGAGMAVIGLGLLARGLTNTELSRLMRLSERSQRRANEFGRRPSSSPTDHGARSEEQNDTRA